ncbi:ABC transporter permease [Streptomyces sp. NBC_01476]|uniref:ABC transporter permease n=1 Tax=Streptomyces sp. NBC_01476 TaxID=2903881 RepID=UPI002E3716BC|nr:ABC transporter permease [Streptomyces sp. NBC_01476]
MRAHRLLLSAALLTVVLTTCVLATFTTFTGAIGDAALRRTLQHQAAAQSTIEVQASVQGTDPGPLDTAVRARLRGAFAGLPATVDASTRSGPFGLPFALRPPGSPKSTDPDLTLLATFDRARMTLVSGSWPQAAAKSAADVQVAVPQAVATALKTGPGRAVTLADRLGGRPLRIRITGVYRPADATSPYWQLDTLDGRGIHTLAFTTYGPMLVADGTFGSGRVAADNVAWQASGDFRTATTGSMDRLENDVRQTVAAFKDDPATTAAQASSGLPDLLDALRRSLLVTRSTLLIGALQLVILAAFALLLVAQLLAEERAGETALLRARGGSRERVAWLAAGEALLLALPAVIAAPLLAGPVMRLLGGTGAMARTGTSLGDGDPGAAWLVSGIVALACALAVIAPALRGTGSHTALRASRARRGALPGTVQAGADVGLLVVAGVAFWQLHRRSSGSGTLSVTTGGGLGVDPVLVAAPALCLLAGTVLVLRLLPLAAKLGERRAARGSGLALALAGWQLARRPRRGAGAVLLLVLAVAMGIFAIGQGASWDRSQRDQARYAVGSDIRVTGMTTPPFGQAGIYASVPGITEAAPAAREPLQLSQERQATALIIDTRKAGEAMRVRPDLTGGRPIAELLAPLRTEGGTVPRAAAAPAGAGSSDGADGADGAAGSAGTSGSERTGGSDGSGGTSGSGSTDGSGSSGPPAGSAGAASPYGFPLPGDARKVTFTAALRATGANGRPAGGGAPDTLTATVLDAEGVPYDLAVGDLPPDGAPHHVVLDLTSQVGTAGGAPAGPLRLIRLSATYTLPETSTAHRLTVSSAQVTDADGSVRPLPTATGQWAPRISFDDSSYAGLPDLKAPALAGSRAGGSSLWGVDYTTGGLKLDRPTLQQPPNVTVQLDAVAPEPPKLRGIATDSFLKANGAKPGDTVQVQLSGITLPVHITAAVRGIPGTGDNLVGGASDVFSGADASDAATESADDSTGKDAGAVLLDLRAVNRQLQARDAQPVAPTEWWVSTAPGASARVASALRARTDVDTLLVADEITGELRADPLGAGPQSALPAAVVAAAVLAAVGFAVSSAGAIRERNPEFAVLRALGAPRRKLARVVAAEQGLLVLISLVVGVVLGELLTRLVTPLIVLTTQASRPVPALLIELPAGRTVELLALVLVVPLLVVLATAVRRGDPASALRRQGED